MMLSACVSDPTYTVFERLVIRFQTPVGVKTADRIARHDYRYHPDGLFMTNTRMTTHIEGEALVADLGQSRLVFALLKQVVDKVGYGAFESEYAQDPRALLDAMSQAPEDFAPRPVPRNHWPQLVIFDDLSDPLSVRRGDRDNLFPDTNERYALLSADIEILPETPVTRKVAGLLPWLKTVETASIDGIVGVLPDDRPLSNRLYVRQFLAQSDK